MTEPGLDIELRPEGPTVVLALSGEIDMASVGVLHDCLEHLDGAWRQICIDLASVSFMDSAGIAELVRARNRLDSELRSLIVTNPQPNVRAVLDMTGVGDLCADRSDD